MRTAKQLLDLGAFSLSITWVGKILILQDSLRELELMSRYLRDQGYKIIRASSAKEAMEITLEEKPDAIITDAVMPGMSGFEFCRFLKRNLSHQQVPIVICSDEKQAVQRLWARKQGADAYVSKPYSGEDLLMAIQSVISEQLSAISYQFVYCSDVKLDDN
ncbi:response regulator receiver protein [Calothrix sp. PCC 7507]|nr:response regulator receiver protein [Calothrix sp. PCC 7507]